MRANGRSLTAPTGTLVTPRPDLIATSQADTYHRDAQATTNARQLEAVALTATFEADMRNIQGTAEAVAATAQAQQTHDALAYQMTVDVATQTAINQAIQATQTSQYQAQLAQETRVSAMATREYDLLLMSQQATRQALELRREETAVKREAWLMQTASVLSVLFFFVLAVGLLFLAYRLIPLIVNRLGLVRFGEQNLPLFLYLL